MIWTLTLAGFALAGGLALVRVAIGPSLIDRMVALDVALMSLMGAVAAHSAGSESTWALNLLAPIALIGFTATVAVAWFVARTGRST